MHAGARVGERRAPASEQVLYTVYTQTAEGPQDRAAWQQLLGTAPRSTDSVGRATIQVCTASDGRGIYATVDYATWQTEKEEG